MKNADLDLNEVSRQALIYLAILVIRHPDPWTEIAHLLECLPDKEEVRPKLTLIEGGRG